MDSLAIASLLLPALPPTAASLPTRPRRRAELSAPRFSLNKPQPSSSASPPRALLALYRALIPCRVSLVLCAGRSSELRVRLPP
ncbi:hypothetical protein ZEAMMB73_Zm00001d040756 [Zea mays]|uniref:Uncharacterized protein n=1 Tax=Zea mays TaxID=4577 RepID=A0A1D6MST1_MAIZE|nr:hypothetical protein ZEAMMB73_Zm00001d040756 [Zea mays]